MGGNMDLMKIVGQLNTKYFYEGIIITAVEFVTMATSEGFLARAYYAGDKYSGKIILVEDAPYMESILVIRQTVFHEMIHQLITEHNDDFHMIEKQIYRGWATPQQHLRFSTILLENMKAKVIKGHLPETILAQMASKCRYINCG